jgi:hypothetical protein
MQPVRSSASQPAPGDAMSSAVTAHTAFPRAAEVAPETSWARRRRFDIIAIFVLGVAVAGLSAALMWGGVRIGEDSAVLLYPMYHFLGEELRQGRIPAWNPYQLSGMPFAGDPQSGWMYLPAIVLFSIFSTSIAIKLWLVFHLALACFGMYAFARVCRIGVFASIVASLTYVLSGWYWTRIGCCGADAAVYAWLPLMLLAFELAIRAKVWEKRCLWGIVTGLTVSQVLSVWLGQGSYYALLAAASWLIYRTLIWPPERQWSVGTRLTSLVTIGVLGFGLGVGLSAGGLLPRLEFISLSTLSDGYQGIDRGGFPANRLLERIADRTSYYAGASAVIVAAFALVATWRRFTTPFFAFLLGFSLLFSMERITPIHRFLYFALPKFEELQAHLPNRILIILYVSIAMLVGSTIDELVSNPDRKHRLWWLAAPGLLVVLLLVSPNISFESIGMAFAACIILVWILLERERRIRSVLVAALGILVAVDLMVAAGPIVDDGTGGLYQTSADMTTYYSPTGSTLFLQNRKSSGPYRYLGFDPSLQSESDIPSVPYRRNFADDITAQLIVNNRASIFRLGDIQGQDFPALPRRYAEFLEAINGEAMDNHDADVTAAGVMSPLLDLLNVRYIVIPADVSTDQPEIAQLLQTYSSVYMDSSEAEAGVQVLERASGLPRAWFVHDVRSVNEGDAIQLLKFGGLNFGETALVEGPAPPLRRPPEGTSEPVSLTVNEPGHVSVVVKAAAP